MSFVTSLYLTANESKASFIGLYPPTKYAGKDKTLPPKYVIPIPISPTPTPIDVIAFSPRS